MKPPRCRVCGTREFGHSCAGGESLSNLPASTVTITDASTEYLYVDESKSIGRVQLWGYRCKCGHEWLGRGNGEPPYCPKCKRRTWNRPFGKVDTG